MLDCGDFFFKLHLHFSSRVYDCVENVRLCDCAILQDQKLKVLCTMRKYRIRFDWIDRQAGLWFNWNCKSPIISINLWKFPFNKQCIFIDMLVTPRRSTGLRLKFCFFFFMQTPIFNWINKKEQFMMTASVIGQ